MIRIIIWKKDLVNQLVVDQFFTADD